MLSKLLTNHLWGNREDNSGKNGLRRQSKSCSSVPDEASFRMEGLFMALPRGQSGSMLPPAFASHGAQSRYNLRKRRSSVVKPNQHQSVASVNQPKVKKRHSSGGMTQKVSHVRNRRNSTGTSDNLDNCIGLTLEHVENRKRKNSLGTAAVAPSSKSPRYYVIALKQNSV